ncbi:hypothetical protein ABID21_002579 [Pseudorhizobium tarimense]|uniref:Transposase n=1 Tax=Pseudorhizobium tarimense TaxID=1079109 RepID=A0ABV2H7D7_9HYPH
MSRRALTSPIWRMPPTHGHADAAKRGKGARERFRRKPQHAREQALLERQAERRRASVDQTILQQIFRHPLLGGVKTIVRDAFHGRQQVLRQAAHDRLGDIGRLFRQCPHCVDAETGKRGVFSRLNIERVGVVAKDQAFGKGIAGTTDADVGFPAFAVEGGRGVHSRRVRSRSGLRLRPHQTEHGGQGRWQSSPHSPSSLASRRRVMS